MDSEEMQRQEFMKVCDATLESLKTFNAAFKTHYSSKNKVIDLVITDEEVVVTEKIAALSMSSLQHILRVGKCANDANPFVSFLLKEDYPKSKAVKKALKISNAKYFPDGLPTSSVKETPAVSVQPEVPPSTTGNNGSIVPNTETEEEDSEDKEDEEDEEDEEFQRFNAWYQTLSSMTSFDRINQIVEYFKTDKGLDVEAMDRSLYIGYLQETAEMYANTNCDICISFQKFIKAFHDGEITLSDPDEKERYEAWLNDENSKMNKYWKEISSSVPDSETRTMSTSPKKKRKHNNTTSDLSDPIGEEELHDVISRDKKRTRINVDNKTILPFILNYFDLWTNKDFGNVDVSSFQDDKHYQFFDRCVSIIHHYNTFPKTIQYGQPERALTLKILSSIFVRLRPIMSKHWHDGFANKREIYFLEDDVNQFFFLGIQDSFFPEIEGEYERLTMMFFNGMLSLYARWCSKNKLPLCKGHGDHDTRKHMCAYCNGNLTKKDYKSVVPKWYYTPLK